MNFISLDFLTFFSIVFFLYMALGKKKWQNPMLLVASYIFYGWWDWYFLSLIFISTAVDYFCALGLDKESGCKDQLKRKQIVALSCISNLGILFLFKYFDFFLISTQQMLISLGFRAHLETLQIILPVGISFYTFQTLSYTIDVYRGDLKPTKNFLDFGLYVSFFPQLVAGPIERGKHLLPQIISNRKVTMDGVASGIQLAFLGFFKKMVLADNLAIIVNDTFHKTNVSGGSVILAILAFSFQIYGDFSGYTDIARGIARMMGFDICRNFNLPYFATNPSDFWNRWHISLSSWLRDYLYIPLGGNRKGKVRTYINLWLVMLLGGLWHGASWNFVLWGCYHGLLLIIFRLASNPKSLQQQTSKVRSGVLFWLKATGYFCLTAVGWFFFRMENLDQIFHYGEKVLVSPLSGYNLQVIENLLVIIVPFVIFQIFQYYKGLESWIKWPFWLRMPVCFFMLYAIILFGAPETNEFIYFQF